MNLDVAFLEAFTAAWQSRSRTSEDRTTILEQYPRDVLWTDYMLSQKGGMLKEVASTMSRHPSLADLEYYGRPVYTIDAVLAGDIAPRDLLERTERGYPGKLYALIEHENGEAVEDEMWKLLWWRCPLKTIIFYDWTEERRARSTGKRSWLSDKLRFLEGMRQRVQGFHPDSTKTKYLLLIGHRDSERAFPAWSYAVLPDITVRRLC